MTSFVAYPTFKSKLLQLDLFAVLLFLYFVTLHADQLSFHWGSYTIRVNNLLALALISCLLIRFRFTLFAVHRALAYPLLALFLSLLLSAFFSPYRTRCFFFIGWFALTLLCYVLLPYFLVKLWDAKRVLRLYSLSFLCVGAYAVFQLLFSCLGFRDFFAVQNLTERIVRPSALCYEPSFYALYMTPFVFLYNYSYLHNEETFLFKHKSKLQLIAVNVLYLVSTSTAVTFAYAAFIALLFFFSDLKHKKVFQFLLGCVSFALLTALLFPSVVHHFFLKFFYHGFMTHHSFYERWIGITNGWKIFVQHPLLGVGLGGYPCYLMQAYLQGDSTFTFLNMHALIGEVKNPVKLFEPMNVTLEVLASLGMVGLLAVGALLWGVFSQAKKALKNNRGRVLGLLFSFMLSLLVLQFSQGLLRTYFWAHFALVFAFIEKEI